MPKSKKLQKQITKKLENLNQLLDKIDEVRVIESDKPETWDPDTLYNLVSNLKKTWEFLEDKVIKGQYDEFGQPLTEEGLCSLVDEYHSEEEEDF